MCAKYKHGSSVFHFYDILLSMRKNRILAGVFALSLFCGCADNVPAEKTEEPEKYTNISVDAGFDTVFQLIEFGYDHDQMDSYFRTCTDMFRNCNDQFDIYNDYEGLANLKTINDNAGIAPVKVSSDIIDMLREAKSFHEISGGAFDITIGSLLKVWHEYRDAGIELNAEGKNAPVPGDEELKEAAVYSGWDKVVINEEDSTVYITDPHVSLDVGGIAKGYAAEMIGRYMEDADVICTTVNAGRNIRTVGTKPDGSDWVIGIADPADGSSIYCTVTMKGSGSFVTSGDYERYYTGEDGKKYHHIIDPKTLKPADYYHSVSIITPDSSAADCLSTTLFTLSIEDGKKVLEEYTEKTGNSAEAVWIMDSDRTQNEEGHDSGDYHCVYTDGIKDLITFAR